MELVALGTVCDMVELTGVNRAFVAKGLVALRRSERPGVRALIEASRLKSPPDSGHLGFLLGPRINAGGRIGEATLGARLLTTRDPAEAAELAGLLDRLNGERQAIEMAAVDEAMAEADAEIGEGEGPPVIVASGEGWHPGVVGLVAVAAQGALRPAGFCYRLERRRRSDRARGARSPASISAAPCAKRWTPGILIKGGGHAMAAGVTVERGKLGALRAFLEARLGADAAAAAADSDLEIDGALSAVGATSELVEELERAGPYGNANPAPVFALPAHRVAFADTVGKGHVRLTLASASGESLKAIAFRAADAPLGRALLAARGKPLHVAGTLSPRPLRRIGAHAAARRRRCRSRGPILAGFSSA